MGEVIGQILPTAIGVALSPLPIIAVILMLFTARARTNSIAFVVGWIVGLAAVGGVVLALGSSVGLESGDDASSTANGVVKLVLGLGLLALAWRSWNARRRGEEEPEMPGWMAALDDFSALKSLGLAVALSGPNPKNLLLGVAAASTIASSSLSSSDQIAALAIYIVIASSTVVAPVVLYLVLGDRVDEELSAMKDWLTDSNDVVMAVLLLVFGFKLLGDGITILSA